MSQPIASTPVPASTPRPSKARGKALSAIALLVLLGMQLGSPLYFEAALLIALMGFVGTVALGKFLLRGDIIE